jgi:YidC/Oxa1 family membrane protein insertase
MENKNLVLALVLMVVVWMGYGMLFPPAPPVTPSVAEQSSTVETRGAETPKIASLEPVKDLVSPGRIVTPLVEERDVVVETDYYRVVFTNVGARIKSFELKQYTQSLRAGSPPVSLVDGGALDNATLATVGTQEFELPAEARYSVSLPEDQLFIAPGESRDVVFSTVLGNGLVVEKTFILRGDGYDFHLRVRLENRGAADLEGEVQLALIRAWSEELQGTRYSFVGPVVFEDGKVHTYKVKKLAEEKKQHGSGALWTAFEEKYFMAAVVPLKSSGHNFVVRKRGDLVENLVDSGLLNLGANSGTTLEYLLYFGPRDLDVLKKVDHQLDQSVNFGFFDIIARPMLAVLQFCHDHVVANYGFAIVLLTVIIKLLFWPLTHKSYKAMSDMQKLQPKMQRLREKYKNDKERMNRALMEFYKENRVNPTAGCLPMVVQIPVFFALYKVLLGSIALRHEPFIFWIQDLSAKDPYYITPIVMGITMFIQQKMTPTSMDSQQAKMLMFMPIIFTFMFLNFPSGLVIYWLVNNLLTIFQQWYIHRGGARTQAS